MVKTTIGSILVAAVLFIAGYISKPSPDDIIIHAFNKCATAEERAMFAVGLNFLAPQIGTRNTLNPLAAFVEADTKGRVKFHEGRLSSRITVGNKTVAYAAFGMYKIPSCKQIRSFK